MADAFKPGYPYGIMLESRSQISKGKPVYGYVLSVVYNFGSGDVLEEAPTADCADTCSSFQ
jgi:hypothetical protein